MTAEWSLSGATRKAAYLVSQHPFLLYWFPAAIGLASLTTLLWYAARRKSAGERQKRQLTVGVALLTLFCLLSMRWPLFALFEGNPDESLVLAGAITLGYDATYWRSVDNATHGPLTSFALAPAHALGLALDYGWARCVGLLMLWGVVMSLYGAERRVASETTASLALVSAVACIGLTTYWDFVPYNGEHPTLLLLCLSGYCLARLATEPARHRAAWALGTGTMIGLVPLAKLQGAPIGAALAAVTAAVLATNHCDGVRRVRQALSFVAGLFLPALGLAWYLWHNTLFSEFWTSFVAGNLTYADRHAIGFLDRTERFFALLRALPEANFFVACTFYWSLGAALVLLIWASRRFSRRDLRLLGTSVLILLAACYAVYRPGNIFHHYLLLLFPPVMFLGATVLEAGLRTFAGPRDHSPPTRGAADGQRGHGNRNQAASRTRRRGRTRSPNRRRQITARFLFAASYAAICLLLPLAQNLRRGNPLLRNPAAFTGPWPGTAVARVARRFAGQDEALLVWGWMARYHVLTGMRQATPTATPVWEKTGIPFWVERFMRGLKQENPPVFIDAVGPGAFAFTDRSKDGFENFPWLYDWIAPRYQQVADVGGARVYVLKERLESLKGSPRVPSN